MEKVIEYQSYGFHTWFSGCIYVFCHDHLNKDCLVHPASQKWSPEKNMPSFVLALSSLEPWRSYRRMQRVGGRHSFVQRGGGRHSFIQRVFTEPLLCARLCSGCSGGQGEEVERAFAITEHAFLVRKRQDNDVNKQIGI